MICKVFTFTNKLSSVFIVAFSPTFGSATSQAVRKQVQKKVDRQNEKTGLRIQCQGAK